MLIKQHGGVVIYCKETLETFKNLEVARNYSVQMHFEFAAAIKNKRRIILSIYCLPFGDINIFLTSLAALLDTFSAPGFTNCKLR